MSKKRTHAPRTPLHVQGGIRAQLQAAGLPRVWWCRRWTEVLETFRLGARLGRGRTYAAGGQVSELAITPGCVTATVQGGAPQPYVSTLRVQAVQGEARERLVQALLRRPLLIARLLVGELAAEIEELFLAEGCPLFPRRSQDLVSRCSCPDYANPCKHLAAVYVLFGEAIARHPLLLLELRGIPRERLAAPAPQTSPASDTAACAEAGAWTPARFYGKPLTPFDDYGAAAGCSQTPAPLLRRLGALPFWRGQERFLDTLEHLYARAATRGWTVWTGEPLDVRREEEKIVVKGANLHLRHHRMRVDASAF